MGEIYTGNNISIDNTGNKKATIKIGGADYQETRSGKNFFNIYDLIKGIGALDIDSEDFVTVTVDNSSGSSQKYYNIYTNPSKLIKPNTKYYLVLEVKEITGTGNIMVHSFNATDHKPQFSGSKDYGFANLVAGDIKIDEITSLEDFSDSNSMLRTFLSYNAGQSGSITFRLSVLKDEPTVESFVYEKYGAMPSPDYPSKVETVGSNVNLFDKDNITESKYIDAWANNGNYGNTIDSQASNITDYMPIIQGKNHVFSYNYKTVMSNNNRGYCFYDKEKQLIVSTVDTLYNINLKELKFTAKQNGYVRIAYDKNFTNIKFEKGNKATPYSPYGMGSVEIDVSNKNFLKFIETDKTQSGLDVVASNNSIEVNGTSTTSINLFNVFEDIKLKQGTYTFSFNAQNPPPANSTQFILCKEDGSRITTLNAWGNTNSNTITLEEDTFISSSKSYFYANKNITFSNTKYELQIEKGESATEIIEPQSQTKIMPIQQEMLEGDYIEDVEYHIWKKKILNGTDITDSGGTFAEFQTNGNIARTFSIQDLLITNARDDIKCEELPTRSESVWAGVDYGIQTYWGQAKILVSIPIEEIKTVYENELTVDNYVAAFNQYLAAKPITIYYQLATPLDLELTEEQANIKYQLNNTQLYDGMNYITATSSIDPELEVTVENPVEDYKIQVSSDGHLIIPELNIKYLIDLNESNIPIMPEATESSVRAAGRDGDIVLNTTYEPITFDIVCYTEDNLTYAEKINAEKNMNRFLNSIKNKTIEIAFEKNNSFYKVKYSGALVTTNFPKHLKFAIPLKSSDSYGKDLIQKSIVGNATGESNTIEEVGAVFVIKGPALNPIISLNDYSMEYTTSILEGARVEIDSNKSTITNINNDGVKINVMKYYNHQFPKIQNGTNTLKILSGIDNDKNVIVMWNDLKL